MVKLQRRIKNWMLSVFTPAVIDDPQERCFRFFEEATELVQAMDLSRSDAHHLVEYVYNRPAGEVRQEIGGVLITLGAPLQSTECFSV